MATLESRERSARRACARRGLMLRRNRRRDPNAIGFWAYRVFNSQTMRAARGTPPEGFPSLAAVETWLVATSRRPAIEEAAA